MAEVLTKQVSESELFDFDFTSRMPTGATVSSINNLVAGQLPGTPAGLTITESSIAGPRVQFRAAGGTNEATYKIECVVTTSTGDILEHEGYIHVINR